jgi:hypothetical protein
VALGPNGLIEGMRPDTAFFDMSTNSVAMVRKISAAFAEKNLYFNRVLAFLDVLLRRAALVVEGDHTLGRARHARVQLARMVARPWPRRGANRGGRSDRNRRTAAARR